MVVAIAQGPIQQIAPQVFPQFRFKISDAPRERYQDIMVGHRGGYGIENPRYRVELSTPSRVSTPLTNRRSNRGINKAPSRISGRFSSHTQTQPLAHTLVQRLVRENLPRKLSGFRYRKFQKHVAPNREIQRAAVRMPAAVFILDHPEFGRLTLDIRRTGHGRTRLVGMFHERVASGHHLLQLESGMLALQPCLRRPHAQVADRVDCSQPQKRPIAQRPGVCPLDPFASSALWEQINQEGGQRCSSNVPRFTGARTVNAL